MTAAIPSGRSSPAPSPGQQLAPGQDVTLAEVITRLRRAMRRAARATDPDNAVSVAQLELLSCLAEHPDARPSQLARLLRLAPNSVTTLLNGLHTRKMITRSSGNGDRRTRTLALTDTGAHAVERWQSTNSAILREATAELHPAWQHLLTAALPALHELIHAIEANAEPRRNGRSEHPT